MGHLGNDTEEFKDESEECRKNLPSELPNGRQDVAGQKLPVECQVLQVTKRRFD